MLPFDLALQDAERGGITRALHRRLRAAVLDGRLPPGYVLPSTRRLAASLGLGRNTVIAAYDLLVAGGHAHTKAGSSTVVAAPAASGRPRSRAAPAAARAGPGPHGGGADVDRRIAPPWQRPPDRLAPDPTLPMHSFRIGLPEHRGFPHEIWRRLSAGALRRWSRSSFGYGPAQGLPELRQAIAGHVAFVRAVACAADDLIVTSGAQQGFDLLARLLVRPGQTRVAVEEPGYPPLRAAFAACGARLVPVAVDAEGLRVDRLPSDVQVICVTPSHQAPTGAVMSSARRAALLAHAARHGAVIVEDDYDGEFIYDPQPQDALQTLDRGESVFYVGSFSKSLFPALRKGFVVAPPWAREPLLAIKRGADSHGDHMTQSTLAAFIAEGHMARHVRRMRGVYARRRAALEAGLRHHLGAWLEPLPGSAGLHLAARLRQAEHAERIIELARRHTPGALSMAAYALRAPVAPALCFGYGTVDEAQIEAALQRLGAAVRATGRQERRGS